MTVDRQVDEMRLLMLPTMTTSWRQSALRGFETAPLNTRQSTMVFTEMVAASRRVYVRVLRVGGIAFIVRRIMPTRRPTRSC